MDLQKIKKLIDKYTEIIQEVGDPNESYKYIAYDTFKEYWNLEASDFYDMLHKSLSKVKNLIYQNSIGYIKSLAKFFPEETRAMFRHLYDEELQLNERIVHFQQKAEELLPLLKEKLHNDNINTQQDERTISAYLSFRYPEKYILYKFGSVYKEFCDYLDIPTKKTGERFLHFQALADKVVNSNLLNEDDFVDPYRNVYPKPTTWDDKYLMFQNIIYVGFRKDLVGKNQNPTDEKIKSMQSKNIILYGAPGTGKTYHTKRLAIELINGKRNRTDEEVQTQYHQLVESGQIVFTTFHQSISYEDFIEGIKPETDEGAITYDIKNGVFKDICLNANPRKTSSFETAYNSLLKELDEKELIKLKTPTSNSEYAISLNRNGNFHLHTGPDLKKQGALTKEKIIGHLDGSETYPYWQGYYLGVIKYLKEKYNFNPNETTEKRNYVIIIDEINRGNVPSIFGELITLIEEDKRDGAKEQIKVMLPYSKELFSVPSNLYIIGTMNTADRSVEALDTALRRRFSFIEMPPRPKLLRSQSLVPYRDVNLEELLQTMNSRIEVLIDKDHQIGHSYFIGVNDLDDLKLVFKDKIIPLLEEYFYGDFGKIGLVLGGKFVQVEEAKVQFPINFIYDNNDSEDKKIYRFTSPEEWDESYFISIYEDE